MARATRMILDLTLVSLRTVRPAILKVWTATKTAVASTRVGSLVDNPVIRGVETTLDRVTDTLVLKIEEFRDRQLPGEMKYLQNELEKVKRKMGENKDSSTSSKAIKPKVATAWQYAKTEVAPPMTLGFFHGPVGQKLEQAVSNAADNFIAGLDGKIKEIDAEEARKIKEKEDEIRAAQEKAKAEALKKEAERKRKEAEKSKKPEAKAAKHQEESKDKAKEKKKEPPKKETTKPPKKK